MEIIFVIAGVRWVRLYIFNFSALFWCEFYFWKYGGNVDDDWCIFGGGDKVT